MRNLQKFVIFKFLAKEVHEQRAVKINEEANQEKQNVDVVKKIKYIFIIDEILLKKSTSSRPTLSTNKTYFLRNRNL